VPRGDGRKLGERRSARKSFRTGKDYVPKGLEVRRADWEGMKKKDGFKKPGSQNPKKS